MKCPYCDNGISRYSAPGFRWPCTICDGTGEVKMTEQEYIQTCTTEQLAKLLTKVDEKFPCGTLLKCNQGCGLFKKCISDDTEPTNEEAWEEWLKQPHGKE